MSVLVPPQPAAVYVSRRSRLTRALAGEPAIFFAGDLVPRNYAANIYPYRAHSHFLYFTGVHWPGAVLLGSGDAWEIFAAPPAPDDPLWIGPSATWDELQAATGVRKIRPLAELRTALDSLRGVATLPAIHPRTRARQASLLGRPWGAHDESEAGAVALAGRDADLADAVISLRLQHDAPALELLRQAADAARAGHLAGMAATAPGRRESDVRAAIEAEFAARGMAPAYGSIVTVHGEVLHNEHSHHPLRAGDLLLADCGAECHGWSSDVTRTWPVSGAWSPTQRAFYDLVLQANQDATAMVRPGVRYRDIHLRACLTLTRGLVDLGIFRGDPEGLVERGAHALFFPHGVGHLLGLDVHDMEDLGDRAGYAAGRGRSAQFGTRYLRLDRDLVPGMLVTIEPGLYQVPAILADRALCGPFEADLDRERLAAYADVRGIRIEDDVLCTEGAPDVLTAAIPRDADAIAALVGAQAGRAA
ncbi:aminopeptidase P family protein [Nannocystis radixulma]|uniref:Xaa-Pro aminopeptidase n=1 Tax=Nannocystis radixulma TaxID=2995305 RepID=A0ABT5B981_9BACT|nr:aminopeptidase P family protein [Nannocystis radixulma]MDC0670079.1 aminopeptidase P family protein [Nannocystis radixulma]